MMTSFKSRLALTTLVGMAAIIVLLLGPDATFLVTATTERVVINDTAMDAPPLILPPATISSPGQKDRIDESFRVEPASGTEIILQRIGDGPFQISIAGKENEPVANLFRLDGKHFRSFTDRVSIRIDAIDSLTKDGTTIVLPLDGTISVGRAISLESVPNIPILRKGNVSVLGRTILGSGVFQSSKVDLSPGDAFTVQAEGGQSKGFVVVNEKPAMTAVARYVASTARVIHYGGTGFEISTSYWDRITKDPLVVAVWAVLLFFGARIWTK